MATRIGFTGIHFLQLYYSVHFSHSLYAFLVVVVVVLCPIRDPVEDLWSYATNIILPILSKTQNTSSEMFAVEVNVTSHYLTHFASILVIFSADSYLNQ